MRRRKLRSRNIDAASYNRRAKILTIWFKRGGKYRYFDVPSSYVVELVGVPDNESVGAFFNRHIRTSFRFERVA